MIQSPLTLIFPQGNARCKERVRAYYFAMKFKRFIPYLSLVCLIAIAPTIWADSYVAFTKRKYYSADRSYFVQVTEDKRATLYRNGKKLKRVWAVKLEALPGALFVTNDGKRTVIVDRYYGNGHVAETPVVIFLDEKGKQIASHKLGDVADLKRVPTTISASHWLKDASLSADQQSLVIRSQVLRMPWPECQKTVKPEEQGKCWESIPYQQLRFALATGEIVERVDVASK